MKNNRLLTKPHYHEEEVDEGTWALSYGDMITLLLSFFVIFFTTDPKQEKLEKMNRHLSFQIENLVPTITETKEASYGNGKGDSEKVEDLKLSGIKMTTHSIGDSIVVTFQATSFYDSGSVTVSKEGASHLRDFASKYLPYAGNYRVAIKGFTDKRTVSRKKRRMKRYDDNLELSALRSISAMRVLQKSGIPLNRMEIAGAGELEIIDRVLPRPESLTKEEINAYSRTIVLIIQPVKESW